MEQTSKLSRFEVVMAFVFFAAVLILPGFSKTFLSIPLIGLLPLIIYLVLCFTKFGQIVAVGCGLVVAAILTGHGIMDIASGIRSGLGSFLGYIGFIILLGGGLGKVLEKTGVVHHLVRLVAKNIRVDSEKKAIFVVMLCSVTIVSLLGTLAGGNAILAPILIPIVASVRLTPNAMAVALHGAGASGLFLGPLTPPVVTLMELTGLSYPEVLFSSGIPVSVIIWIITFFWAQKVQAKHKDLNQYDVEVNELQSQDEFAKLYPNATKATVCFLITLFSLVAYSISVGAGSTSVVVVMLITSLLTGLLGGLTVPSVIETVCDGAKRLIWLFLFFVLLDPFVNFLHEANAFSQITELLRPYAESSGSTFFVGLTTMIGVFGVPGGAVAQAQIIHEMFIDIASSIDLPMTIWCSVLLIGSQMTSFAIPDGDMQGQLGLARSFDLKSVIINGWMIVAATVAFIIIKAMFFV